MITGWAPVARPSSFGSSLPHDISTTSARQHVASFDLIHMHTLRTFQNAVVRHFALRRGIPYVLSAHGTLPRVVQRKLAKKGYDLFFGRALLAGRLVAAGDE